MPSLRETLIKDHIPHDFDVDRVIREEEDQKATFEGFCRVLKKDLPDEKDHEEIAKGMMTRLKVIFCTKNILYNFYQTHLFHWSCV